MRLEEPGQPGQPEPGKGYDAEGRLHKIGYNKLDFGSDFAFYDVHNDDCLVNNADINQIENRQGKTVYDTQQPWPYGSLYDLNSDGIINSIDLSAVQAMNGKSCPRFVYDADGNLMVLEGPKRMVYIGGIFEKNVETGEVTKYYHTADGRRLAMRKGSTLSYFANDHLGGTSVVMNDAGGVVSRVRYYPYGNIWTQETGAPPTDKLFTGQRRYGPKSGIYHYGARFYSADIGRFLSPDTIVPEPGDPQALNRYSYVLNNPLKYSDPTGHKWDDGSKGGCTPRTCPKQLGWKPTPRKYTKPKMDWRKVPLPMGNAGAWRTADVARRLAPIAIAGGTATYLSGDNAGAAVAETVSTGVDVGWSGLRGGWTALAGNGGADPVRKGQDGVEQVEENLEELGYDILGENVTFETDEGRVIPDIAALAPETGDLVVVEVKTGPSAALRTNQSDRLQRLGAEGGIARGENATRAQLEVGRRYQPRVIIVYNLPE